MPRFRIARVLGIPVYIDASWFLIFAFVTGGLAQIVYPNLLPHEPTRVHIVLAGISSAIFFVSILLHEIAHSAVAKFYRIPVKSITLFLLGGVAQITRDAKKPLAELLMAAAGPLTSLFLGVVFISAYVTLGSNEATRTGAVLYWVGLINIALGLFNLIPAFPMDGGRVFRSIVWMITRNYFKATRIAGWTGRLFAWTAIFFGIAGFMGMDVWIAQTGRDQFWLVFMGYYIETMARQGLVQNRVIESLAKYRAEDLMVKDPPVVDGSMTVGALARGVLDINPGVTYFVEDEGVLAGILSGYQMRAVPEPQWDTTTARQAMMPSRKLQPIAPERPANDVLLEMETADLTHLPVVKDGRVLGVVGRDRILRVLQRSGLIS